MSKYTFIATTLYGLENILASEIAETGAEEIKILNRAVEFSGGISLMYKSNLCLRTALRVLLHLKSFIINNEDQLYNELIKIEWEEYFDVKSSIAVTSVVNSPIFRHSGYIARRCKDAIVDRFRRNIGNRPSVDIQQPDVIINIHIDNKKADVSLDSSGTPLFKRGYRTVSHHAPLNEVLAAGLIKLADWNSNEKCLYDPMCGSGTIAIEAALMAHNIYPGFFERPYAFFNWKNYDEKLFNVVKKNLPVAITPSHPVYASDISPESVDKTKRNVQNVGLSEFIKPVTIDFMNSEPPDSNGVIIMNPPYGERISDTDINQFYKNIGDTLKTKYTGYEAWIISPNVSALKFIGLHPEKKINVINGNLKCRYLKYFLYEGSKKMKNV